MFVTQQQLIELPTFKILCRSIETMKSVDGKKLKLKLSGVEIESL